MVSDEELVGRLQSLLCQVDLTRATAQGIRQQLEGELGVELAKKDDFIRHHIAAFMQCHYAPPPPPQTLPQHQQHQQGAAPAPAPAPAPAVLYQHHHHYAAAHHHHHLQQQQHHNQHHYQQQQLQVHHHHHHQQQQQQHHFQHANVLHHQMQGQVLESSPHSYEDKVAVSAPQEGKKRCRAGGLNKVCSVSPELQAIVGEPQMPRTQIVKQLWAYIRANNLQDPNNKRNIICDDALRLVFETDSTDMFQMNKLLARHIKTIDVKDEILEPNPKRVANESAVGANSTDTGTAASATADIAEESVVQPSESLPAVPATDSLPDVPPTDALPDVDPAIPISDDFSVIESTVPISETLASFLGTSETQMPQDDVLKRLCDYIKENGLQDPTDEVKVICDEKLQNLLSCENFALDDLTDLLARHFSRA